MAEITNPQIVLFANERARTMADTVERFSALVDAWVADYAAQAIATQITNDGNGAGATIADGSETDGRQRITGTKIVNLKAALLQVQTALTTTAVSGVGATVKAIADGIQVNGSIR